MALNLEHLKVNSVNSQKENKDLIKDARESKLIMKATLLMWT